ESYELKRSIKTSFQGFNGRIVDTYTASANKFIFKVSSQNYPITFRLIQKTGSNQYRDLREVGVWSFRNCDYALPTKFLRQVNSTDTIQYPVQNDHYFIGGIIYIINSAKNKVKMELGVYPIPATDKIQITGLRSATNVSITSITGKEIKNVIVNPESPEVNIEGLEKGIYILHCQSKEGVQALRIVKQ
ncbi:MAG: T9SS type A sorting domain-containing protein, partial [Flexibacteraceae bacterium]